METIYYKTASDFLLNTGDLLASDEAHYGLIYGIAKLVAVNPHYYGEADPWFCSVSDKAGICAIAWRTPPYKVGLAWFAGNPEEVVPHLIESVGSQWQVIPGVIGDKEVTALFTEGWCKTYKVYIRSSMEQIIYRLDRVNDIPPVPGRLRLATVADKSLVTAWTHAFRVDTFGVTNDSIPERDITPGIETGEIYLWEDGQPVSMAVKCRPTENGMMINYVYTPPDLRRRGYATACVAGVCREILKGGYQFCILYTDLANPTSNSIYIKIGFQPVCDSVEYTLSTPVI